jgi:hypothetical protein
MVSRGYLAAWADKKNTVDVIDIQGRRGFPSSIFTATAVSDVYNAKVLNHDLEETYAKIETDGIPVMVKLRDGAPSVTAAERDAMIAFLDMHLDRGRYAHRAAVRAPAQVLKHGGQVEDVELNLGDALLLSQNHPDVLRLKPLGLGNWEWRVWPTEELVTGDGAVLLWTLPGGSEICTVTFPLSPTRLLIIGRELPDGVRMNDRVTSNSNRWIIGARGSLNLKWAAETGM